MISACYASSEHLPPAESRIRCSRARSAIGLVNYQFAWRQRNRMSASPPKDRFGVANLADSACQAASLAN
jgi:hypothetical protein